MRFYSTEGKILMTFVVFFLGFSIYASVVDSVENDLSDIVSKDIYAVGKVFTDFKENHYFLYMVGFGVVFFSIIHFESVKREKLGINYKGEWSRDG